MSLGSLATTRSSRSSCRASPCRAGPPGTRRGAARRRAAIRRSAGAAASRRTPSGCSSARRWCRRSSGTPGRRSRSGRRADRRRRGRAARSQSFVVGLGLARLRPGFPSTRIEGDHRAGGAHALDVDAVAGDGHRSVAGARDRSSSTRLRAARRPFLQQAGLLETRVRSGAVAASRRHAARRRRGTARTNVTSRLMVLDPSRPTSWARACAGS